MIERTLNKTDLNLRNEAETLLASGLRQILEEYGEVHIVGSYALHLMVWRDLDIHVIRERANIEKFFSLGTHIAMLLKPHRMHFRDESIVATEGLPRGLYWGIYLGDERAGAWKIDIWATDRARFEPIRKYSERLTLQLNDENRNVIISIKEACWRHPGYRRTFSSSDIYSAVLDHGVTDPEGFQAFLKERNRAI